MCMDLRANSGVQSVYCAERNASLKTVYVSPLKVKVPNVVLLVHQCKSKGHPKTGHEGLKGG